MRKFTLGWVLSVAVLLPNVGTAQVYSRANSAPQVTAANAVWQLRGDPVFHAGAYYYPTGPTVFFDGNVMVRTDTFQGVPVYEDATQSPGVVYVPIGGNVVRPYERVRDGELAGTVGSRPPSFPIQRDGEVSLAAAQQGMTAGTLPPLNEYQPVTIPEGTRPIGTGGLLVKVNIAPPPAPAPRRNVQTILQMWVPFEGARWYSSGPAVSFVPDRFAQVGEHGGFPVYRAKNGRADEIFIPSVTGGPIAPYQEKLIAAVC